MLMDQGKKHSRPQKGSSSGTVYIGMDTTVPDAPFAELPAVYQQNPKR